MAGLGWTSRWGCRLASTLCSIYPDNVLSSRYTNMGDAMHASADITQWLNDMREDTMIRLQEAQADIDAIDRVLALYKNSQPPMVAASNEEIRLASIEVLTRHDQPIHRQAIYDALLDMDIHVNGKDPVASLGTVLSRCSKDFHSHGSGIWGLMEAKPNPSHSASIDNLLPMQ